MPTRSASWRRRPSADRWRQVTGVRFQPGAGFSCVLSRKVQSTGSPSATGAFLHRRDAGGCGCRSEMDALLLAARQICRKSRHAEMRAPVLSGLTGSQFHRVAAVAVPSPWRSRHGQVSAAMQLRVRARAMARLTCACSVGRRGKWAQKMLPRTGREAFFARRTAAVRQGAGPGDVPVRGRQMRATPLSRAACATALATALRTRGSNGAGMM